LALPSTGLTVTVAQMMNSNVTWPRMALMNQHCLLSYVSLSTMK
jgi:hypothetical protein